MRCMGVRISRRERPMEGARLPGLPAAAEHHVRQCRQQRGRNTLVPRQIWTRSIGKKSRKGKNGLWKWSQLITGITNLTVIDMFVLTCNHPNTAPVNNPTLYAYFWGLRTWRCWIAPTKDICTCHKSIYLNVRKTCTSRKIHIFKCLDITICFLRPSEQYFSYSTISFQHWFIEI